MFDISGTVNYFDSYDLSAQDQGTDYKDCGFDPGYSPTGCEVDAAISYDLNVQAHLSERTTLYLSILNFTDEMPPIDVVTYGAWNYNPVQGGNMILGRYFRAGVKLDF
jgi:iron complex outermembrane receptor protein